MIQNGTKSMFERDVNVKHLIEKKLPKNFLVNILKNHKKYNKKKDKKKII